MNKLFTDFRKELEIEGKSARTITIYTEIIELWSRYMVDQGMDPDKFSARDFEELEWQNIRSFMLTAYNSKDFVSPATFNIRHAAISSFYQFLIHMEYIDKSPMMKIKKQKGQSKLPVYLTRSEIERVIEEVSRNKGILARRNHAIITLMLATGIRESELMNLRKRDLEEDKITVRNGKGGKDRELFIPQVVVDLIATYMAMRDDNEEWLFVTKGRKKLTDKSVDGLVKKYVKLAGIEKNITPHKLRHSCATMILEETGDLALTQDILGHSSPNTTRIYAHVNNEKKREAMRSMKF